MSLERRINFGGAMGQANTYQRKYISHDHTHCRRIKTKRNKIMWYESKHRIGVHRKLKFSQHLMWFCLEINPSKVKLFKKNLKIRSTKYPQESLLLDRGRLMTEKHIQCLLDREPIFWWWSMSVCMFVHSFWTLHVAYTETQSICKKWNEK